MTTDSNRPDANSTSNVRRLASGRWTFPALLAVVVLVIGLVAFLNREVHSPSIAETAVVSWTPSARPEGEVVRLEIDFGNGAKKTYDALPWREEMTVADVMVAAQRFRPTITFTQVGVGERCFLTSLEGVENEGGDGRNWLYEVNGQPGDVSFCVKTVDSDELVRWRFADEANQQ